MMVCVKVGAVLRVKPGGTAGFVFDPVPAKLLGQAFFIGNCETGFAIGKSKRSVSDVFADQTMATLQG